MKDFPNLAGVETCDENIRRELAEAGIEIHELTVFVPHSEVPTKIIGSVGGWRFERAWYYWVAKGPGISLEDATELHEEHGEDVRVEGHCGCPSPLEWNGHFGTGTYHVDSQTGLNALAAKLREILARGGSIHKS